MTNQSPPSPPKEWPTNVQEAREEWIVSSLNDAVSIAARDRINGGVHWISAGFTGPHALKHLEAICAAHNAVVQALASNILSRAPEGPTLTALFTEPGVDITREDIAAVLEQLWLDGWRIDTKKGRAYIAKHIEEINK